MVKSQIHAGGRGKGKFKELPAEAKGGVRLAKSLDEVRAHAQEMLGNTSDTLNCEAPADDERGQEIERLLDQVFRSRTE